MQHPLGVGPSRHMFLVIGRALSLLATIAAAQDTSTKEPMGLNSGIEAPWTWVVTGEHWTGSPNKSKLSSKIHRKSIQQQKTPQISAEVFLDKRFKRRARMDNQESEKYMNLRNPWDPGVGRTLANAPRYGEHPVDHIHQDFPKSTAMRMGDVLQYKWEAYCDTNGRSADNISLSSERRGTARTAMQIGGVLQYKLEVY